MEKAYERYKDSGVEWIGEIPESWDVIKMKWLSPVNRGASPRPIADPIYFDDNGEFAWVRIADVSASERYLKNTTERLSELGSSLSVKRYPGDFFLSIAGSVGKPIITKIKCCIHDGFVWFPELKINPEYFYYLFQSDLPFTGLGKMGTQLNLNTETIGNIMIPVSTNKEVEKIISYLDYHTQLIDNLISKKETLIQKLQEQRQAIINEAVTKGLNKNVALKDSGIEWLGEIPEHWEVSRLDYLSEIIDPQPDHRAPKMDLNGLPYLGIRDIKDDGTINVNTARIVELAAIEKQERSFTIEEGDIVFGKVGTLANPKHIKLGGERVALSATLVLIKSENLMNRFLKYVLDSNYIWYQINTVIVGATRPALGITQIRKFRILKPYNNINELEVIVNYLDTETSKIHNAIKKLTSSIQKLKDYRQSLISEAVTGKIDVREWQQPENKS
ncbi:restriction endonuclease subunit S [Tenacibaculum maritimum]|uniref:restriction endonuclease subunit S n=1 Tax=Tenacibaculum maritimum TaxID=107401 RepID=UPI0012E44731|nr:restriction endonuclease subunit S [Tenacibaculum maritimum]CAA0198335.1 Restriction modification system DNA specificity domain-containing protein [Tenacibaculum maritimum]CAA0236884.1 conserved hypothetical protein [Tenacibaculum maritimum]